MAFVLTATSLLAVALVIALAREVRLRRAYSSSWPVSWNSGGTEMKRIVPLILLVALAAGTLSGCGDSPDQQQAKLARQALDQQARHTERLVELSNQMAEASRQLVSADAEARRELLAAQGKIQQQLQAQQADVLRQRDELEQERRA